MKVMSRFRLVTRRTREALAGPVAVLESRGWEPCGGPTEVEHANGLREVVQPMAVYSHE